MWQLALNPITENFHMETVAEGVFTNCPERSLVNVFLYKNSYLF